jgi:hypothetical protein
MNDTLDFVKSLWGSMSVPGLTAPTLSVEELDKKINDLKAVESWLNLNMSMLRGSIQALEVQRGTIATLKSVGASLASAVNTGVNDKSIFDPIHTPRPSSTTRAKPTRRKPRRKRRACTGSQSRAGTGRKPEAAAGAAGGQPNAWWNLLQEQFKQAVSTAMASESMMTDAAVKFAAARAPARQHAAGRHQRQHASSAAAQALPPNSQGAGRGAQAGGEKRPARKAAAKPAVKPAEKP